MFVLYPIACRHFPSKYFRPLFVFRRFRCSSAQVLAWNFPRKVTRSDLVDRKRSRRWQVNIASSRDFRESYQSHWIGHSKAELSWIYLSRAKRTFADKRELKVENKENPEAFVVSRFSHEIGIKVLCVKFSSDVSVTHCQPKHFWIKANQPTKDDEYFFRLLREMFPSVRFRETLSIMSLRWHRKHHHSSPLRACTKAESCVKIDIRCEWAKAQQKANCIFIEPLSVNTRNEELNLIAFR